MIVPDASTVVEVLLQTERGQRLEARLFAPGETLAVPLLTCDARLAAAHGHDAVIELA